MDRAVAAAAWTVDFAAREPADARLLLQVRREELVREAGLPAPLRDSARELNRPVAALLRRIATELFGRVRAAELELVTVAVVDLPYATVRRHLSAGSDPSRHRDHLVRAVTRLLEPAGEPAGQR